MNDLKISRSEIDASRVSSLPGRPNASTPFGGAGMSSAQLRAAFDRLPLLLAERFNALIESLSGDGEANVLNSVKTPMQKEGGDYMTLWELLCAISNGLLAEQLQVADRGSLRAVIDTLAPILSPTLTGTPHATTPDAITDSSSRIATTAWVHSVLGEISDVFEGIRDGLYGQIPIGGRQGQLLVKSSDGDLDVAWDDISGYDFRSPSADTPPTADDSRRIATTAYVKRIIEELKGGVGAAYDTLRELADALTENSEGIRDALELIASKDNRTVIESLGNDAVLCPASNHEYRGRDIASISISLPASPDEAFITAIDFSCPEEAETSIMTDADTEIFSTGDDTDSGGVFMPLAGQHYTWVIWYDGTGYQGVVRRAP